MGNAKGTAAQQSEAKAEIVKIYRELKRQTPADNDRLCKEYESRLTKILKREGEDKALTEVKTFIEHNRARQKILKRIADQVSEEAFVNYALTGDTPPVKLDKADLAVLQGGGGDPYSYTYIWAFLGGFKLGNDLGGILHVEKYFYWTVTYDIRHPSEPVDSGASCTAGCGC